MIIDKINNVSHYNQIPNYASEFIKNIDIDIKEGRYELPNNSYANVECYMTKETSEGRFEAHKNYIDIQLLIEGKERIYYTNVNELKVFQPYNTSKDIEFYADEIENSDYVTLDGTNFVMIYPHEAHAPQIIYQSANIVKKIVLKIPV